MSEIEKASKEYSDGTAIGASNFKVGVNWCFQRKEIKELYNLLDAINMAFYTRTSKKEWIALMEKTKPALQSFKKLIENKP